jgi:hypothetical protein
MPTVASACQTASFSSRTPNCVRNHLKCESSVERSVVIRNPRFFTIVPDGQVITERSEPRVRSHARSIIPTNAVRLIR